MAKKVVAPIWSEDGKTLTNALVSDKLKTYNVVTEWYDGTPMDSTKVDDDLVYISYEGKFLRENFVKEQDTFLEKDDVQQMRSLSSKEILLLKMGVYKGVKLNGYWTKGSTPAPIDYYLSDTVEEDDGGSVFEVGGIKLEHDFVRLIDSRYYGIFGHTSSTSNITNFLNICRDKGVTATFSPSEYLIDGTENNLRGIIVPSGLSMFCEEGVVFKITPNNSTNYAGFTFQSVSNININRLKVIGDRYEHTGVGGEWGMGVSFLSSSNISIGYLECNNCWGDGVYFGKVSRGEFNDNITIGKIKTDGNRRQGISIISAKNIYIDEVHTTNTTGTAPAAGIDFEPNHNDDYLVNININKVYSKNNAASILHVFQMLDETSYPVTINVGRVFSDNDGPFSLHLSKLSGRVRGKIRYGVCDIIDAKLGAVQGRNMINTPDFYFEGFNIINSNTYEAADNRSDVISILYTSTLSNPSGYKPQIDLGDIEVYHPLGYTSPAPYTNLRLNNNYNDEPLRNIKIKSISSNTGRQIFISSNLDTSITVVDRPVVMTSNHTVSENGVFYSEYNNSGQSSNRYLILAPTKNRQEFLVKKSDTGGIVGINTTGANIVGLGSSITRIETSTNGAYIKMRCIDFSTNTWEVVEFKGAFDIVSPSVTAGRRALSTGELLATGAFYGLVKQTPAQPNISQADLSSINTPDATDESTSIALVNAIKTFINSNAIPLINATKASQNTELTNQRNSGQQLT